MFLRTDFDSPPKQTSMYYSTQLFVKKGALGNVWVLLRFLPPSPTSFCLFSWKMSVNCCILSAVWHYRLPQGFQEDHYGYWSPENLVSNCIIWYTHFFLRIPVQSRELFLRMRGDVDSCCSDCDSKTIKTPATPLALPAQSTLLRGVVRIEFQLAMYLLADAKDAKGKLTFHEPSAIDLPEKIRQAR